MCVESGLSFPRRDWDSWTLSAAYYLRRARRGENPRRLAAEFADFHAAWEIYRARDALRWSLEARLMTGIDAAGVAASLGTPAAVVEWYEAVFFDIRDRLHYVDLVCRRLINRPTDEPFDVRDAGWKRIAFHGGPEALSRLRGAEQDPGSQGFVHAEGLATRLAACFRIRRRIETTADLDANLLRDFIKIVSDLDNHATDETDDFAKTVDEMLTEMEMRFIDLVDIKNNPDEFRGMEMRASEEFLASLGLPTPYDEIKDLTWDQIIASRRPLSATQHLSDRDAPIEPAPIDDNSNSNE